ncbi:TonB-dependent receptor [Marinoscillum furvescens]|uniref:TonB-dependent receptor-like protein n=1 Tax=Marinoscillum furvescens DSM 4134 TaxID=1122208 RepID=A0A3D9L2D1_MARFU|nr:Plug domain-containing protein [Marinoscillum furvescens]RED98379.1 hypothetical protein C7460_11051 [Marinoscillum furvescens DSM 4134]
MNQLKLLTTLLLICLQFGESQAQTPTIPDVEKIYLHTDRDQYAVGEDLWYKAYTTYAYTNALFDHSRVLYVELISPASEVVVRNVTHMQLGLGHGDMALLDTLGIEAGTYQLRAYTNWSRNFGQDYFFTKEIDIVDVREEVEVATNTTDNFLYDMELFPEGGSLVAGVASQVAFKATYANGKPCKVSGIVKTLEGEQVAEITTLHAGMGSFVLTPEAGKVYIAQVTDQHGNQQEWKLPEALPTGYTMSVMQHKGKHIVSIKTNAETLAANPGQLMAMSCTSRGITYVEGQQPLSTINHSFILPSSDLPEGIAFLTLRDADGRPHAERLIYVAKEHDVSLVVRTDQQTYATREKVQLNVELKTNGGTPAVGSFSLSVTDANIPGTVDVHEMNIASYFFLQSEIKGSVYNPGSYFDPENEQRLQQMDLLLLTQGWRDFLWKKLPTLPELPAYDLERDLQISGRLKRLIGNSPIPDTKINMLLTNKGKSLTIDETTDENGRFVFDDVMFKGNATLLLTNQDKYNRAKGHLSIDSMYAPSPKPQYRLIDQNYGSTEVEGFQEAVMKKHIEFQVPLEANTMLLEDLVVRGSKFNEEVNDGNESIYGTPDFAFEVTDKERRFSNIFIFLQFVVPGLTTTGKSVSFARGKPLILLDGAQVDMEVLATLLPTDIDRVETISNSAGGAVFGSQAANGVLALYTREGYTGDQSIARHSVSTQLRGYYDARVFYAPKYDTIAQTTEPDIRNTIYWNPYIQPDTTGQVTVSYYNSDVAAPVNVVLEGITNTGVPLVSRVQYEVNAVEGQ